MLPLVCIDVDGTLVGPGGHPTATVWAAVDRARSRGQHLALSTARGAFGPTFEWARRLDDDGWHVFHAGAALVHSGTGGVDATALDTDVVEAATRASAANRWALEYYGACDYRVNSAGPMAVAHAALLGVPVRPGGADDVGPVVRVQFVVRHEDVPVVRACMEGAGELSTATSPVMPGATFVSVTPPGATKATALERLAALTGTVVADMMMVGDGHNDLEAIAAAGHGVAMGNAEPEVKAIARHHVAAVVDDGLAEALDLSALLSSS